MTRSTCRLPLLVLFASLNLAAALPRCAATQYFVTQENRNSSDQNPGTQNRPFKTISAAAKKVQPGDDVIIGNGDYRETVIVTISGTAGHPITFEAAPAETVVIKGSDVIKGWDRIAPHIWKASLPPLPERSTNSNDASFWRTNDVRQVFLHDGILLETLRLRPVKSKEKLGPGSFFCDSSRGELFAYIEGDKDPNKSTVEASVRGAWLYVIGSNIVVRGIQMRHSSTLAIIAWPACVLNGDNVRMENCIVTWSDFVGLSVGGNHDRLLHTLVACHGDMGLGGRGSEQLIENCRVIYNNLDHYSGDWQCGGAKLIPGFSHSRVVANEFAYNAGPGLWLDTSCNDNLIDGNYCHDNAGPGIMVEISSGNQVSNNICSANRNGLAADYLIPDPTAAKAGINNSFVSQPINEWPHSTLIYQGGGGLGMFISSSPGSKIFNNTCYLNEGGGITVEGATRKDAGETMSVRDCQIINNISVFNKGPQLILRQNGADKDTHGNISDYNVLQAVGGIVAKTGWHADTALSLSDWQCLSGHDSHSREGDPYFTSPAMGDFRLKTQSPALSAGTPLKSITKDFYGHTRMENNPSIGACELAGLDDPQPAAIRTSEQSSN